MQQRLRHALRENIGPTSDDFTKSGVPWNVTVEKVEGRWRAKLSWLLPGGGGWTSVDLDLDADANAEPAELWPAIRAAANETDRTLPADPAEQFPGPRKRPDGSFEWGGSLPP